jgi:lysozyme
MIISQRGIDFIKEAEGLRLKTYRCSANVLTIGYGSTTHNHKITEGMKITKDEAERMLKFDLKVFENAVNAAVEVPLTQSQYDALVSFTYNVGIGALEKSTLLKKLNKKDYDGAATEFAKWNKAGGKVVKGLVTRRAKEASLFVDDSWEADETPNDYQDNIKRNVPTIINTENISAVSALATGVGAANLDGSNPIAWALAAIMVVGAATFLFLFLKRRGS